jgi:DAK2 domain fusion protein YloV
MENSQALSLLHRVNASSVLSSIDGQDLISLLQASLSWLRTNQDIVNALNVYPVPDGDTGYNMVLTLDSALKEATSRNDSNIGKTAHAVAQGALMGARGNSGVILSQILRGFARALDSIERMDAQLFGKALSEARDTGYKGVVRPVEGTILTVIHDVSQEAQHTVTRTSNLIEVLDDLVKAADASVGKTPSLLPVLKQAGVVDSGGKGLFFILEGALRFLKGQPLGEPQARVEPLSALSLRETMEAIEPGQDFEVVVDFKPSQTLDLQKFYADLSNLGTSIQVGEGEDFYRMHIHVPTENRYKPVDYAMSLGTVTRVAMENLVAQMQEQNGHKEPEPIHFKAIQDGEIAVVPVSPGPGISRVFASLGAAAAVTGGQTMNPSTEQILSAFESLPTDRVIVLPNNKNVLLTAKAAAELSSKKVVVVPTASVPQGIVSMLHFLPNGDLEKIGEEMTVALEDVDSGEITTATRDAVMDGIEVKEGQVIALLNDRLVAACTTVEEACNALLDKSDLTEKEHVTLFWGEGLDAESAEHLAQQLRERYPSLEFEIHEGGQPYYQLLLSIE